MKESSCLGSMQDIKDGAYLKPVISAYNKTVSDYDT